MIDQQSRDVEGDGEWSAVQDMTIIPLHSIVLPNGKVFAFGTDENGMQGGQFVYSIYDPVTGQVRVLENTTETNIFCSYMSIDPATGNVLIMGGDGYRAAEQEGGIYSGVADVNVFDWRTEEIRPSGTGDMAYARWYGTTQVLDNGEILIVGGRDADYNGSGIPEIYNAETGFRELTGADIPDISDNSGRLYSTFWYPHLWQASDGDIFMIEAEGEDQSNGDVWKLTVDGLGTSTKIDTLPFEARNTTPSTMYDVDKVLIAANDGWVWTGDLSTDIPTWEKAFFMPDETGQDDGSARTNGSFCILPNGMVLIIGGGSADTVLGNQLEDAQYAAFVWDPETGETEEWADLGLARLYHSSALTLPDGTIFAGGGGSPGPLQNTNFEIFTPPYLYDENGDLAERPQILTAPGNIEAGDTITLTVDDASDLSKITAIRSGTSTHGRNSDARIVTLDYTVIDETTIEVSTPGSTVMAPGAWMMFVIDGAGVPSEAAMVGVDMIDIVELSTTGTVTELADGSVGEEETTLSTTGYLELANADWAATHTVEITAQEFGYFGTLSVSGPDGSDGKPFDYVSWNFEVEDAALGFLATGESLTQSYDVAITDEDGVVTTDTVTVTLKGADDDLTDDELNEFFGQIDEQTFLALSGFVNGLVDLSRDGSENGSNTVEGAGVSILDAVGGDSGYVTGETPLGPLFQPIADGFDLFFDGARDAANNIGDWFGDLAGAGATNVAKFGNAVSDITGEPTPFIDQIEYYTIQAGGGLAYAIPIIGEEIVDFFDDSVDTALGVANGLLDVKVDLAQSSIGLFDLNPINADQFDGAWGVSGFGADDLLSTDLGDNIVFATEAAAIDAGRGGDLITLYEGATKVDLGGTSDRSANALALNGGDLEALSGTNGQDSIGVAAGSVIATADLHGGNDLVLSGGLIKSLNTGSGHDSVKADTLDFAWLGSGNDKVVAGSVTGHLDAGSGRDHIEIGEGSASGGSGRDTFYFTNFGDGPTTLNGGRGWDTLTVDLDDLGMSRSQFVRELGVWDWWGDIGLYGRSAHVESLDLTLSGIEWIDLV